MEKRKGNDYESPYSIEHGHGHAYVPYDTQHLHSFFDGKRFWAFGTFGQHKDTHGAYNREF